MLNLEKLCEDYEKSKERLKHKHKIILKKEILTFLNEIKGKEKQFLRTEKQEYNDRLEYLRSLSVGFGKYGADGDLYGFTEMARFQYVWNKGRPIYYFENNHSVYEIKDQNLIKRLTEVDKRMLM